MVDIGLGGFHDERSLRGERKLIKFPNLTDGRLADAIALLKAPGTERELRSEAQFRQLYRSASLSWPLPRQRGSRVSVLVGVASVASVFATATGLSAASVLPPSASHVVNSVLGPLNADGGSPTTPPPSATQPLGSGASGPNTTTPSLAAGSVAAATDVAGTNTACRHGKGPCTVHHAHSLHAGQASVGTAGSGNQAVRTNHEPAQTAGSTTPGGSTTPSTGPASAGTGGTGSGSSSGSGSSGSGNGGGQGGSAPGGGRGGNLGAGPGSGKSGHGGTGHHGGQKGAGATGGGSRGRHHSGSTTVTSPTSGTTTSTGPASTGPNDTGA